MRPKLWITRTAQPNICSLFGSGPDRSNTPSFTTCLVLTSPNCDIASMRGERTVVLSTGWGGHLFRRFCKQISESSPKPLGFTAAAMLPKQARGTLGKHITKPSEQVAAPPGIKIGFLGRTKLSHSGKLFSFLCNWMSFRGKPVPRRGSFGIFGHLHLGDLHLYRVRQ